MWAAVVAATALIVFLPCLIAASAMLRTNGSDPAAQQQRQLDGRRDGTLRALAKLLNSRHRLFMRWKDDEDSYVPEEPQAPQAHKVPQALELKAQQDPAQQSMLRQLPLEHFFRYLLPLLDQIRLRV